MKQQERKQNSRISGFTLDQTILVVAVIAILATIIISSVAWSVLNRANATKIASHLSQIANSIGTYYQDETRDDGSYHQWPNNAFALAPYLAGYSDANPNLKTPLGGTASDASLLTLTTGSSKAGEVGPGYSLSTTGVAAAKCTASKHDCYIIVTVSSIQLQEAEEANNAIDGKSETTPNTLGRLRWTDADTKGRVTLTYFAVKLPR